MSREVQSGQQSTDIYFPQNGCCETHRWKIITAIALMAIAMQVSGGLFYHFQVLDATISFSIVGVGGSLFVGVSITSGIFLSSKIIEREQYPVQEDPQSTSIVQKKFNTLEDVNDYFGTRESEYGEKIRALSRGDYRDAAHILLDDFFNNAHARNKHAFNLLLIKAFYSDSRADRELVFEKIFNYQQPRTITEIEAEECSGQLHSRENFLTSYVLYEFINKTTISEQLMADFIGAVQAIDRSSDSTCSVQINKSQANILNWVIDQRNLHSILLDICELENWTKHASILEYLAQNLNVFFPHYPFTSELPPYSREQNNYFRFIYLIARKICRNEIGRNDPEILKKILNDFHEGYQTSLTTKNEKYRWPQERLEFAFGYFAVGRQQEQERLLTLLGPHTYLLEPAMQKKREEEIAAKEEKAKSPPPQIIDETSTDTQTPLTLDDLLTLDDF